MTWAAVDMDPIRRQRRRELPLPNPAVSRVYHRPRLQWLPITMSIIFCLCSAASVVAQPHPVVPVMYSKAVAATPTETLILDSKVPLLPAGQWMTAEGQTHELKMRASDPDSTSPSQASPLPSPLAENLSGNFTKTDPNSANSPCGTFLSTLVANSTFQQCYPFSVLLLGSTSFFQAQRSLVGITNVLDKSCKADVKVCSAYLNDVASQLTDTGNCGPDYNLQNSIVVQLRYALLSYETLYSATCLRDPTTSAYCFASAVTNGSSSQNTYFYYLPMNTSLPADSSPNCNWCLRETMAIYQAKAANRKLPIASTYADAASEVNASCGPGFVNQTMPAELLQNAASARTLAAGVPPWSLLSVAAVMIAVQWLL